MEFCNFIDHVAALVREQLGNEYEVRVERIQKNNNISLMGMIITDQSRKSSASPTIYLDSFYDGYIEGSYGLEDILSNIISIYRKNVDRVVFDTSLLHDFEKIKRKISGKLVNTKKNKEWLIGHPHREFLDLSLIYIISIESTDGIEKGTIQVSNCMMELLGITEQHLFDAMEANRKLDADLEIMGMKECIGRTMDTEIAEDIDIPEMYVVTNSEKIFGAVEMMNPDAMKKAAEIFQKDFIILPSSIHEVLLLPYFGEPNELAQMAQMVREVNDTQVAEQDILSYHVYHYHYDTGKIEIAA